MHNEEVDNQVPPGTPEKERALLGTVVLLNEPHYPFQKQGVFFF